MWIIARLIEPGSLPRHRVVARFDVSDARAYDRFWLLADSTGAEVCIEVPGHTEDGIVTSRTGALIRWYGGQLTLGAAQRDGSMTVNAPPWLQRELNRRGRLNPYAGIRAACFDPENLKPGTGLATAAASTKQAVAARKSHVAPVTL